MRTVTSDFDTRASDFGFSSIPWELRADRAPAPVAHGVWRPAADRQPCRARLQPVPRDRARAGRAHIVARRAGRARGAHPITRVQRAQLGFAALAVTALMTALAVAGLIALAQLRSGDFGSQTTSVVQVAPAPPR
ncbi:hypothetical protein [Nocardia sp. NPDC006630]|uniref:hypothetical protein n=1 Tax=Nocardia sp. NPDC006630 TaxID=3157181 RepID=UPI0033A1A30B